MRPIRAGPFPRRRTCRPAPGGRPLRRRGGGVTFWRGSAEWRCPDHLLALSDPTTNNTADLGAPPGAAPAVLAQKNVTPILTTLTVSDGSELSKGTVVNLQAVKVSADGRRSPDTPSGTFTPVVVHRADQGRELRHLGDVLRADTDVVIKAVLKKSTSTSPGPGYSLFPSTSWTRSSSPIRTTRRWPPASGPLTAPVPPQRASAASWSSPRASPPPRRRVSNGSDEVQFLAGLGEHLRLAGNTGHLRPALRQGLLQGQGGLELHGEDLVARLGRPHRLARPARRRAS